MSDNAHCKKHFINYCPELSKVCPYCRIAELKAENDRLDVSEVELEVMTNNAKGFLSQIQRMAVIIDKKDERIAELEAELRAIKSGHTVTTEFNIAPAMKEGAIRDKLVELGWGTPERLKKLEAENRRLKATIKRVEKHKDSKILECQCLQEVVDKNLISIKAIRELPDKWWKYSFDNPEATEYMDSADCADELKALLPKE